MKRFLSICFFISCIHLLLAQNNKLDSLEALLPAQLPDTQKVNLLNKIGFEFIYLGEYDKASTYIVEASLLSQKLNFDKGLVSSYNGLGIISKNKGDNKQALKYFFKALEMSDALGNLTVVGSLCSNIGRVYSNLGDYPKTLEYFYKAFRIQQSLAEYSKMANILRGIGKIYMLQKDRKALYCFTEALRLYQLVEIYDGIAGALNDMGEYYAEQSNLTQALVYYNQSLIASEKASYETEKASSQNNIGLIYARRKDYEKAIEHYLISLGLYQKLNNNEEQSAVYFNMGELEFDKKNFSKALDHYQHSLETAIVSGVLQREKDAYDGLSRVYEKLGQQGLAYSNYKAYIKVKEQMFNDENTRKLLKSELAFELELKEREIQYEQSRTQAKQKQGRVQSYFFIVLIAFLILLGLFMFQRLTLKQKLKVSKLRNKIASDLHDDVGSALSSISMYAGITQMNKEAAINENIIDKIGKTSRETIENMSDIVWSIQPRNDDFQLVLDKMKYFGENIMMSAGIEFKFEHTEGIQHLVLDMGQRKNLYLIYKEAVNNAAKYSGAKSVQVMLEKRKRKVVLKIEDNGVGFDTAVQTNGNGLISMKERAIEMGGKVDITSSVNEGTKVELIFKVS